MSIRNTLRFALLTVPLLLAPGCATVMPETNARWSADPRAKPVMDGLEAYKHANGDYPFRLSDLQPHYLNPRVPFAERHGKDVVWALYYKHLPPGTYEMLYEDTSSDVIYRNGEVVSARRNPLRKKLDLPQ